MKIISLLPSSCFIILNDKYKANNIPIKGWREYQQSKLANICFTYMLSKKLHGTGVTVNALHPGTIRTRILRERKIINTIMNIAQNFRITGKQLGSETPIYLSLIHI